MIKIISIFLLFVQAQVFASSLKIAAASDLKFAFDELVVEFKKSHSTVEFETTFGSSGKFYEQILAGAPFDLFLSADIELPNKLKILKKGQQVVPYGVGRLVLWSLKKPVHDVTDLTDSKFKKIAIANPAHAPYGKRAEEALKVSGVYEKIKPNLVLGENISQAALFVETGAADVGVIALSISRSAQLNNKGYSSLIPSQLHTPLVQGLIVLKPENRNATEFSKFMVSPRAQEILQKYGFESVTH